MRLRDCVEVRLRDVISELRHAGLRRIPLVDRLCRSQVQQVLTTYYCGSGCGDGVTAIDN